MLKAVVRIIISRGQSGIGAQQISSAYRVAFASLYQWRELGEHTSQYLCGACSDFNRQLLLGRTAGHWTPLYRLFAITESLAWLLCQQESFCISNNEPIRSRTISSVFNLADNCGKKKISLTFVVGPSSFSATQLCRLNERSLQFTRTRLPNFSSNCFTSGSIPEKSSF